MTSQERHEARYQRRRAARRARQEARCAALGSLEEVFSYHTMFKYGRKCCNGVRWKQSTQNFERHLFSHTAKQRRLILAKRWRPKKYVHFTVCERGKIRGIDAPHITDRQIHKVISKEVLEPLYDPSMIYDNGASRIGKGLHWQIKRIKQQLARHYRKYGRAGGVLLLDLKKFFPYAPHSIIYQRHQRYILNPDFRRRADTIIDTAPGEFPGRGMPLGSGILQRAQERRHPDSRPCCHDQRADVGPGPDQGCRLRGSYRQEPDHDPRAGRSGCLQELPVIPARQRIK